MRPFAAKNLLFALFLILIGSFSTAFAAPVPTTTQLSLSSGSITDGTVVVLTATVTNPSAVTRGMVLFCNASAAHCEDIAILGTAQLTSSGTAAIKLHFGVGTHSIKAVFVGTTANASSSSSAQSVTVVGNSSEVTSTSLAQSGSVGNYTLSGSVAAFGRLPLSGAVDLIDQTAGSSQIEEVTLTSSTMAFADSAAYVEGSDPYKLVIADFNGDGTPDLAVADGLDNSVSMFLGNGDGTFQTPVKSALGFGVASLAVGDFNGDGLPDLAALNESGTSVSVLLGAGNGSFQNPVSYTTGGYEYNPYSLAVADINGDGIPDLITSNNNGSSVSVLLGNGDGTFQSPQFSPAGSYPTSFVVADFNRDGIPDLVLLNSGSTSVSILLGNGDGTFQSPVNVATSFSPNAVAAGDFNGDGIADLALLNYSGNSVSVLFGNGDGTFQTQVDYATGSGPYSVAVGDFNGDGAPDLAALNFNDNSVSVLLGNGDGTFQASVSYASGISQQALAVGDFNGDGAPDMAVATATSTDNLLVFLNSEITTFSASGIAVTGEGGSSHNVVAAYAGDSVHAASTSSPISLIVDKSPASTGLSLSASSVAQGTTVALTATVTNPSPVTSGTVLFCNASAAHCEGGALLGSAQLTSVGSATIHVRMGVGVHNIDAVFVGTTANAMSTSTTKTLTVTGSGVGLTSTSLSESGSVGNYTLSGSVSAKGDAPLSGSVHFIDQTAGNSQIGEATLGATSHVFASPLAYSVGSSPNSVASGDFNGDGVPDLAVTNFNDGTVSVLLGNGDGTFQPQVTYATGNPEGVAVGDFNGDGIPDLVVSGGGYISVFLGNGDGTFQARKTSAGGAEGMAVGDFNGDGILDVAAANPGFSSVSVFLGNGDGTFQPQVTYATGSDAYSIAVGDFNGDGILDIVAPQATNTVWVLLGNADGTFQPQVAYAAGNRPNFVAVGDFNGDGVPDLASANFNGNTVSVLLGNGDGTFQPQVTYATGSGPFSVAVGDFNGDGAPDLATINLNDNTVSVLLGNGDGTFQTQAAYATGSSPEGVAVGDFNGDGAPDLATANNGDSSVSILLSSEAANFSVSGAAVTGSPSSHTVVATYSGDSVHAASTSSAVTLTAPQAPTITWGTPAAITDGTPLSATQLDATASVPGTFSYSPAIGAVLSSGTQTLNVTFAPTDSVDYTTATAQVALQVLPPPTTTGLSSSVNPSTAGQNATFTALVNTGGEKPTGTVAFTSDGTSIGSGTVTPVSATNLLPYSASIGGESWGGYCGTLSGATLDTTGVAAPDGTQTATKFAIPNPITCSGGVGYGAVEEIEGGLVAGQIYTISVWLRGSVGGEIVWAGLNDNNEHPITLTNTWERYKFTFPAYTTSSENKRGFQFVGSTAGETFYIWGAQVEAASTGGPYIATGSSSASGFGGIATLSTSALPAGTDSIVSSYSGDANDAASASAPLAQTVTGLTATGALTSTANPSTFGQNVTFTCSISGSSGTPTGSVSFWLDGTVEDSPTLANGSAQWSTSAIAVGSHDIGCTYAGDSVYAAGVTHTDLTQIVNRANPTISISNIPGGAEYGGNFTATISYTGDGTTSVSSSSPGVCSVSGSLVAFVGAGVCTLAPSATEGVNYAAVTGAAQSFTVGKAPISIAVTSSLNPSVYGQTVTFTVTATGLGGSFSIPTGVVQLTNGATSLGTISLVNGSGSLTIPTLPAGSDSLTATYGGDGNYF